MTLRALRIMLVAGALALAATVSPALSPVRAGQILDPAAISATTLPNGMRVVVKEAPGIDLVALDVWVRAGSVDETEENNGVAHFIEHLMFKGSRNKAAGDFDMEIESLGGLANAATMDDATQYYVVVPSQFVGHAIEALGDLLSSPAFPESTIRREQRIVMDELGRAAESPEQILTDWLNRLSFQKHPYRLPRAGTVESVRKLNQEKIQAFYDKHYVAGNMTVTVVGAVKASDVVPRIQAAFAGLRTGQAPVRTYPPEPIPARVDRSVLYRNVNRGYLLMGYRGPGIADKDDVCAMDVILYLLGESRAQSGRLNRELRHKQGLVSEIWAEYTTMRDPGLVGIWAEADPEKLETVREIIVQQVALIRDNVVPDDEIQRAKMLLLGVYNVDNETYDGQASTLGFYDAKDTYQFAVEYPERIMKVTAADIQRVARKYLGEENYSVAMLRPRPPAGVAAATAPEAVPEGMAPGEVQ